MAAVSKHSHAFHSAKGLNLSSLSEKKPSDDDVVVGSEFVSFEHKERARGKLLILHENVLTIAIRAIS